jgi:hypothetical protein
VTALASKAARLSPAGFVFSGDVSVLKCQTEKDAQTVIAATLDLLENPDEWSGLKLNERGPI